MILAIQIQTSLYMILVGIMYAILLHCLMQINQDKYKISYFLIALISHIFMVSVAFYGLYQLNKAIFHPYYGLFLLLGMIIYRFMWYPLLFDLFKYVKITILWIIQPMRLAKSKIVGIIKVSRTRRRMKPMQTSTKKQKRSKKRSGGIWTVIFLLASCGFIYQIGKDIMTTINLKNEIAQSDAQIDQIEEQIAQLEQEKDNLGNPEYVKRFARGKYMVSKEGEQLFKLPSSDED